MLPETLKINKGKALFPRIDVEKEIQELEKLIGPKDESNNIEETNTVKLVDIEDFAKIKLVAAEIKSCEPIKKSKKLLKLTVNDGKGERIVVSGISPYYKPDELIGKTVILVSNLKPAKLCGTESQGMILAASCSENDVKVIFLDGVKTGSEIR